MQLLCAEPGGLTLAILAAETDAEMLQLAVCAATAAAAAAAAVVRAKETAGKPGWAASTLAVEHSSAAACLLADACTLAVGLMRSV